MFEATLELLDKHEAFLISGHVNPDGDCVGTQAALYHLLKSMGKEVAIVNDGKPEKVFDFLEEHTPYQDHKNGAELPEHEVHFLVDCNELSRLGSVGDVAKKLEGKIRVVVDHHVGAEKGDGDHCLCDVGACACGVLIYDLMRKAGAPMTREAAEGIFASIVADTGWFRFSNTDEHALAIAADLVAHGVSPNKVYHRLFMRRSQASVDLISRGLANTRFVENGRVAVLALDNAYVQHAASADFNTDTLLDAMRAVDGVDVVLLLKELGNERVKVSLRASENVDVDGVARLFGGGGHKKAAGAEVPGTLSAVEEKLIAAITETLRG